MKKNILIILIIEILVPIIFLLISIIFLESQFNEYIYKFVLPIIVAVVPILFAWYKDIEMKIREEKVKNYNQFLDALTTKFSNMGDKNKMENENFCKEANRLSLYASNEVIKFINEIGSGKNNNINDLLQRIRKDLINCDFNDSNKIELKFHIDSK